MKFLRWILTLSVSLIPIAFGAEEPGRILIEPVHPTAESRRTFSLDTGAFIETNRAVIHYGDAVIVADRLTGNRTNLEVLAEGNVLVQKGALFLEAATVRYNLRGGELTAEDFRGSFPPFFVKGESLNANVASNLYAGANVFLTTDDVATPGFRASAESLKFALGQFIEVRGVRIYAGDIPGPYLPYYARKLSQHITFLTFTPGYRSAYGPFMESAYHWALTPELDAAVQLDYYSRRGIAYGPEARYNGPWGRGDFSTFFLHDQRPGLDPAGRNIAPDRRRIDLSYSIAPRTNLFLQAAFRDESDPAISHDFFESDYRGNPQPKSFVEADRLWPNFSLQFLAQGETHDFFGLTERLPETTLNAFRQQLGISPFYYESQTSFGYYQSQAGFDIVTNEARAFRADTFHQLLLPETFLGWLNITPYAGGRFTRYDEVENAGPIPARDNRIIGNAGLEISAKASRIWTDARSALFDLHGLRHIIEPSLNYIFVRSSKSPDPLPQFDTSLPSLALLPIDFPGDTAIDAIDQRNVVRFSVANRLQTKRRETIENLAEWTVTADWRLAPTSDQNRFDDIYSSLRVKPRSSIALDSEVRYSPDLGHLRFANHSLTFEPGSTWSWALGHRYFGDDPLFGPFSKQSLIYSSFSFRLNQNWAVRASHQYEATDRTLEEQNYTLYHDMRSWTAALTFRVRHEPSQPADYGIAFTFSSKAFPRFKLGDDTDTHALIPTR